MPRPHAALPRLLLVALVAPALLLMAAPAHAKSYSLPRATLAVTVTPDGFVDMVEEITFDFDGEFHGAWRDIPFRFGQRVPLESISVAEGEQRYGPGGDTPSALRVRPTPTPRPTRATGCASCGATTPPTSSEPSGSPTGSSDS